MNQKFGAPKILTSKGKYPGVNQIIARLQEGQKILDAQHEAWMNEDPDAWKLTRFGNALAHWENLERILRTVYAGCIWNGNQPACKPDSVVMCDRCVTEKNRP